MSLDRKPKGFMFDLDGTLILSDRKLGGYTAIPGAAEVLSALDARSIPWIAMTNGSAYPASVQARRECPYPTNGCSRRIAWRARPWSNEDTSECWCSARKG